MRRDRDAMESLLVIINGRTPLSGYVWELRQRETISTILVSQDKMDALIDRREERGSVKSEF